MEEVFIKESNKIEGIYREPTKAEIEEFNRFMAQDEIGVACCDKFVSVYQPNAILRKKKGLDVRIGNHVPPRGGREVLQKLLDILNHINMDVLSPYETHIAFEALHPFTDCNGRLGRMIWMWQMKEAPLGFLHTFYYQTLANKETP